MLEELHSHRFVGGVGGTSGAGGGDCFLLAGITGSGAAFCCGWLPFRGAHLVDVKHVDVPSSQTKNPQTDDCHLLEWSWTEVPGL